MSKSEMWKFPGTVTAKWGENCDKECSCVHGVSDDGKTGTGKF